VGLSRDGKAILWRGAARVEQEIRAYPRVYMAFYRALNASPTVRRAVGRVKSRLRHGGAAPGAIRPQAPQTLADQRREQAITVRLGLRPGVDS
jgi:hypothetical protein